MTDVKQFSPRERRVRLGVKGVGPTVIGRLEQLGYHPLGELAEADTGYMVRLVASMLATSCWQNSPQARDAIAGTIALARSQRHPEATGEELAS